MTDVKLISFDGIPGSGKSSTALWLGAMLQAKGMSIRVIQEDENPHPIRFLTDLKNPLRPWLEIRPEKFSRSCLDKFSRFLEKATTEWKPETILVVDGLFFHTDSTSLFLMDPEKDVFNNHIIEMHRLSQHVQFLPLLLYNQPYASALKRIMELRSEEWRTMQIDWKISSPFCTARELHGSYGYVKFYEQYESLICDLFKSLTHKNSQALMVENPANDWGASRKKIWSFCIDHIVQPRFFSDLL